jgi:hypothetical protein
MAGHPDRGPAGHGEGVRVAGARSVRRLEQAD